MDKKTNDKKKKESNSTEYEFTRGSKIFIALICVMAAVSLYILYHVFPAYLNAGLPL